LQRSTGKVGPKAASRVGARRACPKKRRAFVGFLVGRRAHTESFLGTTDGHVLCSDAKGNEDDPDPANRLSAAAQFA
jgi:hypothetical protein